MELALSCWLLDKADEWGGAPVPVICHIENMLLRPNSDFFQDLLASVFADMVPNHDAMSLASVSVW